MTRKDSRMMIAGPGGITEVRTVDKDDVLRALPPYRDKWVTLVQRQNVDDIIDAVVLRHQSSVSFYDRIGKFFVADTIAETCDNLYWFCKQNIQYEEEGEDWQSVAVPNGMLIRGRGDCKHYASFIGGCLGAINRQGLQKIRWHFCFASYKLSQRKPYHVFVIAYDEQGGEIWVDPTPGSENKFPVWAVVI